MKTMYGFEQNPLRIVPVKVVKEMKTAYIIQETSLSEDGKVFKIRKGKRIWACVDKAPPLFMLYDTPEAAQEAWVDWWHGELVRIKAELEAMEALMGPQLERVE